MCAAMQKLLWLGVGVGLGGWPLDDTFCTIQKCQFWSENNFSLNICLGANYIRNQYWPMQKNTALISDPKNMSKIWIYVERASRYKLINLSRYKGFVSPFFCFALYLETYTVCMLVMELPCAFSVLHSLLNFSCHVYYIKYHICPTPPPPLAPWDF